MSIPQNPPSWVTDCLCPYPHSHSHLCSRSPPHCHLDSPRSPTSIAIAQPSSETYRATDTGSDIEPAPSLTETEAIAQLRQAQTLSTWKWSPLRTPSLSSLSLELPLFRRFSIFEEEEEDVCEDIKEEDEEEETGTSSREGTGKGSDRRDDRPGSTSAFSGGTDSLGDCVAEFPSPPSSQPVPVLTVAPPPDSNSQSTSASSVSISTSTSPVAGIYAVPAVRTDSSSCASGERSIGTGSLPSRERFVSETVGTSNSENASKTRSRNIWLVGFGQRNRQRVRRFGSTKGKGVFVGAPLHLRSEAEQKDCCCEPKKYLHSTGRGGLGNIRPSIYSHKRTHSHSSNTTSSSSRKHESVIFDIRRLTLDDPDMAILGLGGNRSSVSTTSSGAMTRPAAHTQMTVMIPRTRSHASIRSACTHSSVSTHSTRASSVYTTHSSAASYHTLPVQEIDPAETEHLASSPGTHLSPTTMAYLRPYAPNAESTPATHISSRRNGMTSTAASKARALAKLVSPSSLSINSAGSGRSPSTGGFDDNHGQSSRHNATSSPVMESIRPDMIVSTAGREVPVPLDLFDKSLKAAQAQTSKASTSASASSNIPTHSGSDPPIESTQARPKKKSSKSRLTLPRKLSTGAFESASSPSSKEEIDEAVLLEKLRQQAKARARTGRGGLGNPSKIIIEKKKWMDNTQFPTTAALMAKHEEMLAAQERAIIEQSNAKARAMHSTGRGGAGNNINTKKLNMMRSRSVGRGVVEGVLGRRRRSSSVSSTPPLPTANEQISRRRSNSLSRIPTVTISNTTQDEPARKRPHSRSRAPRTSPERARSRSRSSVRSTGTTKGRKGGKGTMGLRLWWRKKDVKRRAAPEMQDPQLARVDSVISISPREEHSDVFTSRSVYSIATMSCNDNSYIDEDEAYAQGTYHDCDEGIEEEPDVYDVDLDLPPSPTKLRTTSMGSTLDHPDVITHYIGGRRDSDYSSSQSPADVDLRIRDPHYLSSLSPHSHARILAAQSPRQPPRSPLPQTPTLSPTSPLYGPFSPSSPILADLPARALAAATASGAHAQAKRMPAGGRSRAGSTSTSSLGSQLRRGEAQVSVGGVRMGVVAL